MQLFFPVSSAAYSLLGAITTTTVSAESLAKEIHDNPPFGVGTLVGFLLFAQIVAIIAYWIASKAVAGENGTFGNACKIWLLNLIVPFGIALVVSLCLPILSRSGAPTGPFFLLGVAVLVVALVFLIPMKVYQVGFWPAFGFLILTVIIVIIGFVVDIGVSLALVGTQDRIKEIAMQVSALSKPEQEKFFTVLFQQYGVKTGDLLPGELEAGDRSKTPQERLAAIQTMYAELQKRRAAINPNDKAAVSVYDAEKARYDQLLKNLQADAAATRR